MSAAIERLSKYQEMPGYASMVVDLEAGTFTAWWKGEVPTGLQNEVGIDANGVDIRVGSADYTEKELSEASHRAFDYGYQHDIPVVRADYNHDGSGLSIAISPEAEGDQAIEELLRQIAGVPVTFSYEPAGIPR